ncbi:unnamed protein product [Absidia cylindrospora]
MSLAKQFITSPRFVVVGASTSRAKYGNKILRWYQLEGLNVVPVHPVYPQNVRLSIITPPNITLQVLKDCEKLGIRKIWLQPGAENEHVLNYAKDNGLDIIAGGPCLLVQGTSLLAHRNDEL